LPQIFIRVKWTTACPNVDDIAAALKVGDTFKQKTQWSNVNPNTFWWVISDNGGLIVLDNNSPRHSKMSIQRVKFAKQIMVGDWIPVSGVDKR
jgi:hypothetical protein